MNVFHHFFKKYFMNPTTQNNQDDDWQIYTILKIIAGCSFMQHASIFNPEIFIPAHATEKENYIPG